MTDSPHSRTLALLGPDGLERLARARVLVVGVGGVGGYAAEVLARSGVGSLTLLDADEVAPSNINRQLVALHSTIGCSKVELEALRIKDINPACSVTPLHCYLTAECVPSLLAEGYDFVADCIDTVAPKVALLEACLRTHTPVISSMGAGGRLDPTRVQYARLEQTREDGLARAVRETFKRSHLSMRLPVVFSDEAPRRTALLDAPAPNKRTSYGTLATIPAIFGLYIANYIIRHISKQ